MIIIINQCLHAAATEILKTLQQILIIESILIIKLCFIFGEYTAYLRYLEITLRIKKKEKYTHVTITYHRP